MEFKTLTELLNYAKRIGWTTIQFDYDEVSLEDKECIDYLVEEYKNYGPFLYSSGEISGFNCFGKLQDICSLG